MRSPLNPRIQAAITIVLLAMLGGTLFAPIWFPDFKPEASVLQTVLTLAALGVQFFLGTSSGSAAKDERAAAMTTQILDKAAAPPVKVDDSTPISVKEVK